MKEPTEYAPLLGSSSSSSTNNNNTNHLYNSSPFDDSEEFSFDYLPETILSNFHSYSIAFSIIHAIAVTCLSFTSTLLDGAIGSYALGIMYVGFATSSLLIASAIVLGYGSKQALHYGLLGYTIFILGFLLSIITVQFSSSLTWIIATISFAIGGVSGGILWTTHGRIYRLHAKLYSERTSMDLSHGTSQFAAIFTMYFLGFETIVKLLASILYLFTSDNVVTGYIIFTLYSFISIIVYFISYNIVDFEHEINLTSSHFSGNISGSHQSNRIKRIEMDNIFHSMTLAGRLLYNDMKLVLLIPFQITYGLTSSMIMYYLLGTIILDSNHLGEQTIGLFSAIIVLSGAILATPFARYANNNGKNIVMMFGSVCFFVSGMTLYLFSDETIGTWKMMIPYTIIFGMGRGVWENTNKAVLADFYDDEDIIESTGAYSIVAFFTGYAAALGFFCFYYISRARMVEVVVLFAIISMICTPLSFVAHRSQQLKRNLDKRNHDFIKRKLVEVQERRDHTSSLQLDDEHISFPSSSQDPLQRRTRANTNPSPNTYNNNNNNNSNTNSNQMKESIEFLI